jgi:hypothetical protein
VGGEPLVAGADAILHNQRFLNAARALFGNAGIRLKLVVVNLNAPMPADVAVVMLDGIEVRRINGPSVLAP